MYQTLEFDPELIRRYDASGPRYTSYPTAVQFSEAFDSARYRAIAQVTNTGTQAAPLSLYFHIPFCDTVCFYCACNKIITKNRSGAIPYLEQLFREIDLQGALFDRNRPVDQLHWGGGTPTFHQRSSKCVTLMRVTGEHFQLRKMTAASIPSKSIRARPMPRPSRVLRSTGVQPAESGRTGFRSRGAEGSQPNSNRGPDLGGAGRGTRRGFQIDQRRSDLWTAIANRRTLHPRPSTRSSPSARTDFGVQLRAPAGVVQDPATDRRGTVAVRGGKAGDSGATIERLTQAGYVYIGMDHFARPDDELARGAAPRHAVSQFPGLFDPCRLRSDGLGATSIGKVGNSYSQNLKALDDYAARIDSERAGGVPGRRVECG